MPILYNLFMKISKNDIDIKQTLECGQIFRYIPIKGGYEVYSLDKYCTIKECNDCYVLESDDENYFYNFFALNDDYNAYLNTLRANEKLKNCIPNNPTIRILKQDPFEMIISFIISANNNIPRIKGIISRLCSKLGVNAAFPTVNALASQSVDFYKSVGLGYRAPYILDTAKKIASGEFDINYVYKLSTEDAKKYLMTLPGVGPKVADCILLFGYNRFDVFPVDTWVKKIYLDLFNEEVSPIKMRENLLREFGDLSGIAQQYLFNAKRNY